MPIFCDIMLMPGAGRSAMSSSFSSLSMDIAASWPCATAQMMFFGPKAESPPKKTLACVDWNVWAFSFGKPLLSNSMPGVLLDPGEGVLLPHRDQHVVAFEELVGLAGLYQGSFPV